MPHRWPLDAACPLRVHALEEAGRVRDGPQTGFARWPLSPYIGFGFIRRGEQSLETPCVDICQLDTETGTCLGCGRTRAEIASWAQMSDAERRAIMAVLPARMAGLKTAKD
jgi:uncharacterized protein